MTAQPRKANKRKEIARQRFELGMTQRELAEAAGIHPTQMNLIEQGKAEPLLATGRKISQVLGKSIEELFPH